MRTIQIINVRWFNATAWYGLYLAKLLQEAGHETKVLVLPGTDTERKAKEWGFEPVALDLNTTNPVKLIRLYKQLLSLIKDFDPHVVNCHRGEAFVLWGLLKKQFGSFALVRTRGDQRLPKNNLPNRWLHQTVADAVVATNSVMANHFKKVLSISAKKVHTIFGGVDTSRFYFDEQGRHQVRNEFGYSDDEIVIGMLGRFDEVKGQKELIQAVAELYHTKGYRQVRLMLLGFETATSQAEVEEWITENNISDIAVITGKRNDVAACISAIDIGLVASKWSETIARAAFEIMACKRLLLATDVGVMPDFLPPDALIPLQSELPLHLEIAERVALILNNTGLQNALLNSQQARIATLSGQDFLKETLSLYTQILPNN